MEHRVVLYIKQTDPSPHLYIDVKWDDVSNSLVVYTYTGPSGTPVLITSGSDLVSSDYFIIFGETGSDPRHNSNKKYTFCDGANLITFDPVTVFPYSRKVTNVNHFSCASRKSFFIRPFHNNLSATD